jgi:hypothetical protein
MLHKFFFAFISVNNFFNKSYFISSYIFLNKYKYISLFSFFEDIFGN